MDILSDDARRRATRRRLLVDLLVFGGIAFAITWIIVGLYIWNAEAVTRLIGPMALGAPAFYLAVYAPALAAIVVTAVRYGRPGLASLFGSLLRIRAKWIWIAISLLGYPALWLVTSLVAAASDGRLAAFDFHPWLVGLPLVLLGGHLLKDPGALGEELGWRGFALPRLLELTDARIASLVLGVVWAVWHLPAFYVGSLSQSGFAFLPFVLQVVAFSVFMAWLFVNTRGSVLWAGVVPHMMINATPHAGIHPVGWVFIVVAALILVFGGRHLRGPGRPRAVLPQSALLVGDRETP
jgi:membrane protease YdiL (CAAX protease family)